MRTRFYLLNGAPDAGNGVEHEPRESDEHSHHDEALVVGAVGVVHVTHHRGAGKGGHALEEEQQVLVLFVALGLVLEQADAVTLQLLSLIVWWCWCSAHPTKQRQHLQAFLQHMHELSQLRVRYNLALQRLPL